MIFYAIYVFEFFIVANFARQLIKRYPLHIQVEPKSGPKAGGTTVTLTGKNFGHTNGLQSVKIGTGNCLVQFANYTRYMFIYSQSLEFL